MESFGDQPERKVVVIKFRDRTIEKETAAAGWISVIIWSRICSREQNKYLRDLEMEIDFFDIEGGCEQGGDSRKVNRA